MNQPLHQGQITLSRVQQQIERVKEDIEMKVVEQITRVKSGMPKGLAGRLSIKALAGLAAGAVLLTTTLSSTPSYAYTPESFPSIGGIAKFEEVPGDSWRFDAPFYDVFRVNGKNNPPYRVIGSLPERLEVLGFTPNQQVEILGEMDDYPVTSVTPKANVDGSSYGPLAYRNVVEEAQARINALVAEGSAKVAPPSYSQQREADRMQENWDYQKSLADFYGAKSKAIASTPVFPEDDAWSFDAPFYEDFRTPDVSSYPSYERQPAADREVQRLEDKVGVLLTAAQDPSANPQQLNRELERLDYQIGVLLAAATAGESDTMTTVNRVILSLEDQINEMLATSGQDPKVNQQQLDRKIRSLDCQVDALLQADMLER